MAAVLMICLALLVGSIPTGVVLTRLVTGTDIRTFGSGNIGAANAARAGGFRVGIAVAVLDILKGVIPVCIARSMGLDIQVLAIVALAAVLGHDFSIFLRFRGGKGVATSFGVMLALAPGPTLLALLTYLVIVISTRYSSLASLCALALLPGYVAVLGGARTYVVLACVLFLITAAKHWENILRLSQGKESRFNLHGR